MKVPIGSLIIQFYQLEDLINILLNNNYIVELENNKKDNKEDTILVTIYQNFNKSEREEK